MSTTPTAAAPNGGAPSVTKMKEEFGSKELTLVTETASTAVAEQARAAVQARFVMALQRPRDWDEVRTTLLKDCKRPGFAQVARYAKPVGGKDDDGNPKKVVGPSIRFAEAAIRAMKNLLPETTTIFDDLAKRIVRVALTDLEANVSYTKDITIAKTVERKFLKKGQTPIRTRINSYGDPVHVVEATDEDLLNKENALVSKALRGHALRLLPGDILEDCMTMVLATLRNEDAKDPDAARKKLVDAFSELNVSPSMLKDYLGHEIGTSSPAEIEDLRDVYVAVKDGESTWASIVEAKHGEQAGAATAATPAGETPKTAAELTEKLKRERKAKKPETTPAPASEPAACPACHKVDGHVDGCPEA